MGEMDESKRAHGTALLIRPYMMNDFYDRCTYLVLKTLMTS